MEKIAVITDSCADIPPELVREYGIFVLPLIIRARGREYRDGVDITAEDIYKILKTETPKTSLPSGEDALALLDRAIWHTAHGHPAALGAWALHLAVLVLWGYVGVCALWGTQYYAESFAEKAGMEVPGVSAEQLTAVTRYFARQVAACADTVSRDEQGRFAVSREEIFSQTAGLYDGLTGRWPFLAGPERKAKPAFYSRLMSAWGFTGYLCPLTGESTLNVDCAVVVLPVTITHEFAHQRGVAAEQEANFVGIMASITSGRADYVYSGWLYGYLHLSNALYRVDPAAASASMAGLPETVLADFAQNNAYWASWEGPIQDVGESVYNAFLESYGQTLGMQSYGACVDLLVEEFLPCTGWTE